MAEQPIGKGCVSVRLRQSNVNHTDEAVSQMVHVGGFISLPADLLISFTFILLCLLYCFVQNPDSLMTFWMIRSN